MVINNLNQGIIYEKRRTWIYSKNFLKAYETKNILDLAKAPVSAIRRVSELNTEDLKKAFGIKTVEDLATNKYVKLSQGINYFFSLFWKNSG